MTAAPDGEPTLPPLLQVIRDAKDPQLFSVRVKPLIEGTARVRVHGRRAVEWVTPEPAAALVLRRGEADRVFQVRVLETIKPAADGSAAEPDDARIGLEYYDAQGRLVLTVDQPFPFAESKRDDAGASPTAVIRGVSAGGAPVRGIVPADAPAPIVRESGP